ncbi:MAG: hypothetical protein OEX18_15525 [Candidatus Krumholzibacteria bacterium]|nr:hypothetical protein [Candidatus Krumholzibacteria bacterium]MDH4338674.1 hypothetical protein [Candidatus Krumholzibacteria bacterium]MDH5271351.1 hypothetical protein [Candidatus Krumholzibacteria bacterium]
MKRSMILMLVLLGVAMIAPAWADNPTAAKAVAGEDAGLTTLAITVSSNTDDVYGVTINGAAIDDIRAPKGWVGIASGSNVMFRTGDNPVKRGNSLAFRVVTRDASAGLTVSFRGKEDPLGTPVSL